MAPANRMIHSHEGCSFSSHQHTSQTYTTHYNPISTLELKSFILARTGQDVPQGLRRFQYIRMLEDLDRDFTFRFMDLPPEMRNLIYEELLSRDKAQGRKAHLAIMRVSKLLHKETVGIFNDTNTADLKFYINGEHNRYGEPGHAVYLRGDAGHSRFVTTSLPFDAQGMFAAQISGLPRMKRIRLTFRGAFVDQGFLGTLVSAFVDSVRDLRSLTVYFPHRSAPRLSHSSHWLPPLVRLSKDVSIEWDLDDLPSTEQEELLSRIDELKSSK